MIIGGRPFGKSPFGGSGDAFPQQGGAVLSIGPTSVTDLLQWEDKLKHRQELSARDELEFTIVSSAGYVPNLGQPVLLGYQSGILFVGSVHERDVEFVTERTGTHTRTQIRCVDINELADRRLVVEVFENLTTGEIVRQIVIKYLFPELIQIGDVQEGPLVTRFTAAYLTAAECFDQLCEKSGFVWNIGVQREMNFFARTTSPAPFTIDSSNAVFRRIRGSRTRNQYRNVQYVDGGRGVTDERTETFRGDGTLRTFHVEYPLFNKPTIQRQFEPQTSGIRGIHEGQQWSWNAGETAIGQAPGDLVLAEGEFLHVSYRGIYNLMSIVEDTSSIVERQGVEGGTGRYEQLTRDDQLDGQDLVQDKGLALLRRFASLDDVVTFETDIAGLGIGQLLTVNVPEQGLVGEFLITKMDTEFIQPTTRRFRVTATTGELKGRFQEWFAALLGSRKPISIREGETLQEVLAMHDPVGVTDSIEATLIDVVADEFGPGEFGHGEFGP